MDFRYNSRAHEEQEATHKADPEEKRYESAWLMKKALAWHPDSFKNRYASKEFKL